MALIIRAISYKGLPPNQEISGQFGVQGGTIGRAPNNHLVLPDPEKFVSRLHATIVFEAGRFFIQDSSTGGTFLHGTNIPLHQARAPLHDGEKLRIGDYELLVTITDAGPDMSASVQPTVRQLDLVGGSAFNEPVAVAKPAEPEDFFASFIEQPESSPAHECFIPPQVVETPASQDVDDLDVSDLLAKLDALPGVAGGSGVIPTADLPPLPADFFADEPKPQTETAAVEPESCVGLDFPEKTGSPAQPIEDMVFEQTDPFARDESAVCQAELVAPEIAEATAEVFESAVSQPLLTPGAESAEQPVSVPIAKPQPSPAASASLSTGDQLVREFLLGAGIVDPNLIAPEQWPALMRSAGELLRSMVEGLMQVLRARAELKSQFRVSVTTMRSVDNNPLKFTPNVDDAMRLILAPTHPGFLPPQQAVSEGFSDIMNHQIAMTAGIQAALADILRSFDPQLIEKTQGEGVLFQKKAKCWDYYVETYPHLKAAAQEEFFGDAFAQAYEKQMLMLSRANPKS